MSVIDGSAPRGDYSGPLSEALACIAVDTVSADSASRLFSALAHASASLADTSTTPADIQRAARAMVSATTMPEAGWDAYAEQKSEVALADVAERPWLLAETICRAACDITVGPWAQMSERASAEVIRDAMVQAVKACGDEELVWLYMDEALRYFRNGEHGLTLRMTQVDKQYRADHAQRVARVEGIAAKAGFDLGPRRVIVGQNVLHSM